MQWAMSLEGLIPQVTYVCWHGFDLFTSIRGKDLGNSKAFASVISCQATHTPLARTKLKHKRTLTRVL